LRLLEGVSLHPFFAAGPPSRLPETLNDEAFAAEADADAVHMDEIN